MFSPLTTTSCTTLTTFLLLVPTPVSTHFLKKSYKYCLIIYEIIRIVLHYIWVTISVHIFAFIGYDTSIKEVFWFEFFFKMSAMIFLCFKKVNNQMLYYYLISVIFWSNGQKVSKKLYNIYLCVHYWITLSIILHMLVMINNDFTLEKNLVQLLLQCH